ncbi:hypothetical protein ACNRBS_00295 [Ralstonia pseudosolanacearum]|uniref:DUF6630 family protein n=1 Tax=Ralstonia pseudosolanacearum TaxID=1310165 RepID=UPI00048F0285|nr:hypothetical protein [Ralstonia pseudosolanacearum]ARU21677.1 Tyrosyl-tRNA synthetase [Ralstonia solanacearum]MDO3529034.1 hypothetical protein [Ralstonia pseudosolanacearum]MDO3534859.1 hypothetical protein [Ralstonia pseudosolanacearum]MDO3556981.1 hypothetical protein [Ralstonia pseudosolanacearum]MDO3576704.1 hypothetical protein [Ralstonia pseudosolanacearum]
MLKRFKRLFSRPAPAREAEAGALSDDDILRESFSPPAEAIEALAEFARRVAAPLGNTEADRLATRVRAGGQPGDDVADLLVGAIARDPEADVAWTLAIGVDWKASDEIAWQANALLDTLGITARWEWTRDPSEHTVAIGLLDFGDWLRPHGYHLLHVDTGGDDYFAVPLRATLLDEALAHAGRAELKVEQAEAFRVSQHIEP